VVTYVAGALTELSRIAENRELFFNSGGVQALLRYQMSTDWQLIVNVNNALANCALHPPSLALVQLSVPNRGYHIAHFVIDVGRCEDRGSTGGSFLLEAQYVPTFQAFSLGHFY